MIEYIKKAKILQQSSFKMYGVGNFDLDVQDIATILMLLDNAPDKLTELYDELQEQRLG